MAAANLVVAEVDARADPRHRAWQSRLQGVIARVVDVGSESSTLVKKTHEPSLEFLALRKGERQRRFSALWSVISAAPSTASAFY